MPHMDPLCPYPALSQPPVLTSPSYAVAMRSRSDISYAGTGSWEWMEESKPGSEPGTITHYSPAPRYFPTRRLVLSLRLCMLYAPLCTTRCSVLRPFVRSGRFKLYCDSVARLGEKLLVVSAGTPVPTCLRRRAPRLCDVRYRASVCCSLAGAIRAMRCLVLTDVCFRYGLPYSAMPGSVVRQLT